MASYKILLVVSLVSILQWNKAESARPRATKFSPCSTPVLDCATGDEKAEIHMVHLNDCTRPPCLLTKGSNSKLEVIFTPKVSSSQLEIAISGLIGVIPVPWTIPGGSDACTRLEPVGQNGCVQAGVKQKFTLDIPILTTYPTLAVVINLKLKDAEDRTPICMKMRATLKPPAL